MTSRFPAFMIFLLLLTAAMSLTSLASPASATLPVKWRELEPIYGGPVNRITVDTAGTVWLSTPGGVFKSNDAGASWASARGDLPSVPTGGAILADPATAGTVYLWMTQGFFRTTDGGTTWTRLPLELPTGVYVNEIAVAPSDPTHLFAATWGDYVYRSLDNGTTWERRSSGLSGGSSGPAFTTAMAVDPLNADRVYTSTWRGRLFRSDDGATTWSQMSDSGTWANSQMYVARSSPNVLYTLHDEYWFGRGTVLRSADHGDTWTAMARPDGPSETWQLAVDPTDEDLVYAASLGGIARSVDGGTSWSTVLVPAGQTPMGSVGLDPGNVSRVYGGHAYSGFYRSLDAGASWEPGNAGLAATRFTGLEIVRDAPATVYAGVQGMGFLKSTDGGASWALIGTAQGLENDWIGAIAAHPGNPDVIAATTSGGAGGRLWKSIDGGTAFTETATGYAPSWIRFNPHTPSVVHATASDWQGGFLRSTDTAASWSVPYFWYIYAQDFDYHPTLANVVFSLGDQYTGAALTTLHVVWSNDAGASWTGTTLTTSLWGSVLALDQNDPATLYMATELTGEGTRGVYKFSIAYSSGDVASVTRVPGTFNSGLTDTKVLRLVYDKVHSALYAATPSGLFRSLDQAATWTFIPGLPYPPTPWMAVTPDGSRLLAGSAGGVWELGPNAAPMAGDQAVSTAEDTAAGITLAGSDADGDTLAFAFVSGPEHGALSGTPPGVTYTPDADYFGPDAFTFEVDDGLSTDQGMVSLTVTPVNDPPWFDPIADASVPYNAGPQAVAVTGLSPGPANESDQSVTLAAVSGSPAVAADPAITWSGPVLLDELFLGGEGDQRGRGIAVAGGAAWLSVDTAAKFDPLIARYDLPLGGAPAWTRLWPDQPGDTAWDELPGIGVAADGVYTAGRSWSQTTDGVGDKEAKSVVVKMNLDGSAGGEATGAVWVYKPHYHSYTGHEGFNAATVAVEGGQACLYAAGGAQVNFCNHRPMAMKVDASGSEVWRYADTAGTCGDAMAFALAVDGGSVYLAGRVVESGVEYPYLAKLDAATGALAWVRQGSATFPSSGSFLAVAVSGGTVYAAGWQAGAGVEDYFLDAWDADGNHVPLSSGPASGARAERLTGLVSIASELWAVGFTRSQDDPDGNGGAGFSDGVLFEIDPATGAALSTTVYGAGSSQDEAFQAVTASGLDLYIAGESRSSTAGGNTLGSNDAVLLRYVRSMATLHYTPLAPGTVTFTVTADDGQAANNTFSRTFTVTVTNDPPAAGDQAVSTAEDTAVDITLTGSDAEGASLDFALVSGPEHGALSGTPPGVTYTPDADYFGPDAFTFEVDDGLSTDQGTVSLTVTPVNDPPWFDPIADASVPYNAGPQAVAVTGVSPGPANESGQSVTLAAVSGNPTVAANPAITWSGGPVLLDELFLGGEGDQRGRGIAVAGGAAWLSVDTAAKVDPLIARYDLPLGAAPAWTRLWPDQPGDTAWDELPGIGVADDGVYTAGRSWSQTTDGVGDKEAKSVVVKMNPDGSAGGEATGAVWVYKPHYHPYTGHEGFNAATVAVEGGQAYLYAAGGAQVNFCNHRPMAMKVDASGSEAWRYADTAGTCGDAIAFAVAVDGGSVYLAGRVSEGGVLYPYLAKLDAATGTLTWARQGSADFPSSGSFLAVTVSGGTVYAAGWKAGAGDEDYLLDAWDADGNRVPLSGSPASGARAERITGITGAGPELWAVGFTRSQDQPDGNGGAGFSDGVLFEIDPATGAALSTTVYGAASGQDEGFQAMAASGSDLYVAGESRSSTAGGNTLGSNDAVLLHYASSMATLHYTPLAPGTVTFTVTADDGQAANNTFSRTFTVTVTNGPPVAADDSASTPELTPVTIDVLANDADPEGDPLVVTGHTAAAHGAVTCGAASCTYAPELGFRGADSFTYTAEGGLGGMDTATVSVTVTPSPGFDFYTVVPCRAVDTRTGSPLASGVARTLTLAGLCGIPATAKAVAVNVTAISPTASGHLILYPGGTPVPATSVLNFAAGVNRANNAHLVLAPSGASTVEALAMLGAGSGQVHLAVDVIGYYE